MNHFYFLKNFYKHRIASLKKNDIKLSSSSLEHTHKISSDLNCEHQPSKMIFLACKFIPDADIISQISFKNEYKYNHVFMINNTMKQKPAQLMLNSEVNSFLSVT